MRGRVYAAGAVLAVVVVGACSHDSGDSSNAGGVAVGGGSTARGAPALAPHRPTYGDVADRAGGGLSGSARTAPGGGAAHVATKTIPLDDGSYKIRIARITVAVKGAARVAGKADEATSIAEQAGGEIDADDRTSGPHASATLLLRVPPDALTATLTALSRLGIEKSRQLSVSDVTQQVADVDSRVASARQSIARLRLLFAHARKISDIIQLESELNSRESELESLEAQQRALSRETSMASITLSLVTAVRPIATPAPKHHDNAFVGGLKRGWDSFTGGAAWVAEAVGVLLPFLVLLLVLGVAARFLWPRLSNRTGRPTPAPTPSD